MSLSGRVCRLWNTLLRRKWDLLVELTLGGHRGILWFGEGQVAAWNPTAGRLASALHPAQAGELCAHQHDTRRGSTTRSQAAACSPEKVWVASAWPGRHPRRLGRNSGGLLGGGKS